MKQVAGIWLPDWEARLVPGLEDRSQWVDGMATYQHRKREAAFADVRRWRTAIDVGAHVGLWAMHLARRFRTVEAFEPLAVHRECFLKNVPMERVILHACALGAETGGVAMRTAADSSGDSWVSGTGDMPLKRLDDVLPDVTDVDLVKVDCEGYELFVLQGAEALLTRCRPCVIVEQKRGKPAKYGLRDTEAVDYLKTLGAVCRDVIAGDYIMSWPA